LLPQNLDTHTILLSEPSAWWLVVRYGPKRKRKKKRKRKTGGWEARIFRNHDLRESI
jgi:hypothetical protein